MVKSITNRIFSNPETYFPEGVSSKYVIATSPTQRDYNIQSNSKMQMV